MRGREIDATSKLGLELPETHCSAQSRDLLLTFVGICNHHTPHITTHNVSFNVFIIDAKRVSFVKRD